jgi:hypothetical protein
MKPIFFKSVLILVFYSCGQTNSNSAKVSNYTNSTVDTNITKAHSNLSKTDSIDKINNETIAKSGNDTNKAFVFLKDGDSTIYLTANMKLDHRIFGYSQPDIKSEKLLLLSVFTNDIEKNPFGCRLGAYYDTDAMSDLTLKYVSTIGQFVKANTIDKSNKSTIIYFEKRWIDIQ